MTRLKSDISKDEVVGLVDSCGKLEFDYWYKGKLSYKNETFTVILKPDYRDFCGNVSTLYDMLLLEDYYYVEVYEGFSKPFKGEWYKKGDNL